MAGDFDYPKNQLPGGLNGGVTPNDLKTAASYLKTSLQPESAPVAATTGAPCPPESVFRGMESMLGAGTPLGYMLDGNHAYLLLGRLVPGAQPDGEPHQQFQIAFEGAPIGFANVAMIARVIL